MLTLVIGGELASAHINMWILCKASRVALLPSTLHLSHIPFMIAPTVQQLVSRASDYPFPGARIVMGEGTSAGTAIAFYEGFCLASAYEPIFDVTTRGLPQSLTASVESAERFGDELGFQALTLTGDGASFDPFAQLDDDPKLVELDRLSRALHAFNFFERSGRVCCSCVSTNVC